MILLIKFSIHYSHVNIKRFLYFRLKDSNCQTFDKKFIWKSNQRTHHISVHGGKIFTQKVCLRNHEESVYIDQHLKMKNLKMK